MNDGQKVLQLSAHTDGTPRGTSQAEVIHQRKFFEGTYAARVRFSDTPTAGADGDHLVQTFFTITPLAFPNNESWAVRRSHAGWHTLTVQVSGGVIRYFVDDTQVALHTGRVYPETPMMIAFQEWFIGLTGHSGGRSTYTQQNDWVLYSADQVLSPAQARDRVAAHRAAGTTHLDTAGC